MGLCDGSLRWVFAMGLCVGLSGVLSPRNVYLMVQKVPENREHIQGLVIGCCDGSLRWVLRWVFALGLAMGLCVGSLRWIFALVFLGS